MTINQLEEAIGKVKKEQVKNPVTSALGVDGTFLYNAGLHAGLNNLLIKVIENETLRFDKQSGTKVFKRD